MHDNCRKEKGFFFSKNFFLISKWNEWKCEENSSANLNWMTGNFPFERRVQRSSNFLRSPNDANNVNDTKLDFEIKIRKSSFGHTASHRFRIRLDTKLHNHCWQCGTESKQWSRSRLSFHGRLEHSNDGVADWTDFFCSLQFITEFTFTDFPLSFPFVFCALNAKFTFNEPTIESILIILLLLFGWRNENVNFCLSDILIYDRNQTQCHFRFSVSHFVVCTTTSNQCLSDGDWRN